ncbi:LPXTG cell wall anchor domain-containing protein [Arthrobacter sp. 7Tela_A1]
MPKTGAESVSPALIGGWSVAGGSMLVLAALRRRQG